MTPGNRRVSVPPPEEAEPSAPVAAPQPVGGRGILSALRTVVGALLVAGASTGVAWVARRHVIQSPRFAIAVVDVAGNARRSTDAVIAESGLTLGANIFTTDLDAARARILGDPWIADATLARRLPATILVRVTERKAGALVALGDTFLATPEGEPFKVFEPDDSVDLPLVTGLRPEDIAADREGGMRTIRRALDLAAEYERGPLARRAPLEEVHVEPDGAFSLIVGRSGLQLVLGSPPFRRKLDQATRVVAELDKRGAKADSIMLDNDTRPERVVVRIK
jgi:cell division protein FtsQ